MDISSLIGGIILKMREYQKLNNIKGKCVDNTTYAARIINSNGGNIEAKSYIVISVETTPSTLIYGHLALNFKGDIIIEPSYEVFSIPNCVYFDNLKDVIPIISKNSTLDIKEIISRFLLFTKYAELINSGETCYTEGEYINKLDDYIEEYIKTTNFKRV